MQVMASHDNVMYSTEAISQQSNKSCSQTGNLPVSSSQVPFSHSAIPAHGMLQQLNTCMTPQNVWPAVSPCDMGGISSSRSPPPVTLHVGTMPLRYAYKSQLAKNSQNFVCCNHGASQSSKPAASVARINGQNTAIPTNNVHHTTNVHSKACQIYNEANYCREKCFVNLGQPHSTFLKRSNDANKPNSIRNKNESDNSPNRNVSSKETTSSSPSTCAYQDAQYPSVSMCNKSKFDDHIPPPLMFQITEENSTLGAENLAINSSQNVSTGPNEIIDKMASIVPCTIVNCGQEFPGQSRLNENFESAANQNESRDSRQNETRDSRQNESRIKSFPVSTEWQTQEQLVREHRPSSAAQNPKHMSNFNRDGNKKTSERVPSSKRNENNEPFISVKSGSHEQNLSNIGHTKHNYSPNLSNTKSFSEDSRSNFNSLERLSTTKNKDFIQTNSLRKGAGLSKKNFLSAKSQQENYKSLVMSNLRVKYPSATEL